MFLRYCKVIFEDFFMLVFLIFYFICYIFRILRMIVLLGKKDYISEYVCRFLIYRKYMIFGREIGLKNYFIIGDNMLEFVFN